MSMQAPITDTTLFLYSVITASKCKIDFKAVGAALNLKTGTAQMRYHRMKTRLEKTNAAQAVSSSKGAVDDNSLFLYQCLVASGCKPDWNAVGVATGLKAGTAQMRWRRLKERIAKEHGPVVTPSMDPPPTPPANIGPSPAKVTKPKKRKASPVKDESQSDGEDDRKKVKLADEATPEKRQTRGKVLDLKGMLDSSYSGVGSSDGVGTSTSVYKDSKLGEEDDENISDEELPKRTPATASPTSASINNSPFRNQIKTPRVEVPITRQSASPSARHNPRLTPGSVSALIRGVPSMPKIRPPVSPDIARSIEVDDGDVTFALNGLSPRRLLTPKRHSRSEASKADDEHEPADDSSSASTSMSLQAQVHSEPDHLGADDMSSVAPDDSVSSVGRGKRA